MTVTMRDDIAACMANWTDKATIKKARGWPILDELLDKAGTLLGSQRAQVLEGASTYEPDPDSWPSFGILALTPLELVFVARDGNARISLKDVDSLDVSRHPNPFTARKSGPIIDIHTHGTELCYLMDTPGGAERLWPALQENVARAKETPVRTNEGSQAPVGVAEELAKLADLHFRGVLTDEEFEAAKARVLSQ